MPVINEFVSTITTEGYEIDLWAVRESSGRRMYIPHIVPDEPGLSLVRLRVGIEIPSHVRLFETLEEATKEGLRVRGVLVGESKLYLPKDSGRPDLIAGACSECRVVGRLQFGPGAFKYTEGDRVQDYKTIRAFCGECGRETTFVPIQRGASPFLDKKMDEFKDHRS